MLYGLAFIVAGTVAKDIVVFLLGLFTLVCEWCLFAKTGIVPWKCAIPIYGLYELYKFTWGSGWYILLLAIPVPLLAAGVIIVQCIKMSKSFGHGIPFAVGLMICPFVFEAILAFGNSRYIGPQ